MAVSIISKKPVSNSDYFLTNLSYIKKNINHFKEHADLAFKRFEFSYGKKSPTAFYKYYNCVSLLVGSPLYYRMFKDVFKIVRKYSKTKKPLWIQCWLNYHYEKKLNIISDWHCHPDSLFHGYIAIEPQDTKTVFENYTIENKIGNVYIGLSENKHKVISNSPYNKERITIAFDVVNEKKIKDMYNQYGDIDINSSFIPIY